MSTAFKILRQLLILLLACSSPALRAQDVTDMATQKKCQAFCEIKTPSTIHFHPLDSALARVAEARSFEERLGHVGCGGSTERSGLQLRS